MVQSVPRLRPGAKAVMDLTQAEDWGGANLAEVVAEHK
jgi:hypothetical protein